VNFILKNKLKIGTKEALKLLKLLILSFSLISILMILKYKPVYAVTISGKVVGYVSNIEDFNNLINSEIINTTEKNVDSVSLTDTPSFELKLVSRSIQTNESDIIAEIKANNTSILYKYYAVLLNDETEAYVDTLDDAEEVIAKIKNEYGLDLELNLQIVEKYTENAEEVKAEPIEVASQALETEAENIKIEKEKEDALPSINGIKLAITPVQGVISSRYGSVSSLRKSTHTGLDIACSKGTPIQVVSDGTVTFAQENGSYGNLVKVDHGNGVETWYAHCDKIYVEVGDVVSAGDIIAAVGSTGNSTGPHLHLEIRVNGSTLNPQNYLYNN
jgi:murein DD-endopeptidase MepM/ murein hydrolase activator NlpD